MWSKGGAGKLKWNPLVVDQRRLTHSMLEVNAFKDGLKGWISPSLDGLLNYGGKKNLAKNLEMTTTINGPRGEFNFIFCSAKSQRTHSFRVKYVVCLPTKVVWDLTELFLSTVWPSLPSLAAKNIYKECDINSVCELNKLDKPIFFDRQNHNGDIYEFVFRLEFDTSSVWQRD